MWNEKMRRKLNNGGNAVEIRLLEGGLSSLKNGCGSLL
jgi:hypothetical protein